MSDPVLILTLSFGMGHASAACSVVEAWEEKTGQKAIMWDAIPRFPFWFRLIYVSPYWWMIRYWPEAWRKIFQARLAKVHRQTIPHSIFQWGAGRLLRDLSELKPRLILAAEVGACEIASLYKTTIDGSVALAALVTDFASEPVWIQPGIDLYLVPSTRVARQLSQWGSEPCKIEVVGIPVRSIFRDPMRQRSARNALGLSSDRPVILMMAGGMGPCHLEQVVLELEHLSEARLQLVALAGKNGKLLSRLQALRLHRVELTARGWTDHVAPYMAAADVLITKPGALTLSEAQAMSLPTVAFEPLPGLEEENLRELVRSGRGVAAENPQQAAQLALNRLQSCRSRSESGHGNKENRSRESVPPNSCLAAMEIARHLERLACEASRGIRA